MHNIHLCLVVYKRGRKVYWRHTPYPHFLQYTVEKLGKADSVTELDTELEDLSRQLENIRLSTEKILVQVQSLVVPNPGEPADTCTLCITQKLTHTYLLCLRPPHWGHGILTNGSSKARSTLPPRTFGYRTGQVWECIWSRDSIWWEDGSVVRRASVAHTHKQCYLCFSYLTFVAGMFIFLSVPCL